MLDFFDLVDLGLLTKWGKRVIPLAAFVALLLFRPASTNFLYGQAVQKGLWATAPVLEHFGHRCSTLSEGVFEATQVECVPVPTSAPRTPRGG